MDRAAALRFCDSWLPLWTGNHPDALVAIYAPDAFYRDPAVPQGLTGRDALLAYFGRLLARNPDWVWTADDVWPCDGGFTLRWKAAIPVGATVVHETGLDLVLVEGGLVTRNEVYFDRAALHAAVRPVSR